MIIIDNVCQLSNIILLNIFEMYVKLIENNGVINFQSNNIL